MEVGAAHLTLDDTSAVGAARRQANLLARQAGLGDTDCGRAAVIVTEAATNAVKHGDGGTCLLRADNGAAGPSLEIVVFDAGRGIGNLGQAQRDGFSSAGTPGTGLGAIARMASTYDIYTRRAQGTALYAAVRPMTARPAAAAGLVGAVSVPYPGEVLCGDGWVVEPTDHRVLALVTDGLGHGEQAHAAARAAADAFAAGRAGTPLQILERIHAALRPTRGAAVAIAEVDRRRGVLRFAGLGNISATVLTQGKTRSLVSLHGTAGHDARRLQEFASPWVAADVLVLHSDGINTRWTLDAYPGLIDRHPTLVAAVLLRDFRRGRDDATVVVVRDAA